MPERRPNILFLFPDQHRGDWLGMEGTRGVRTPNIDGLAARGLAFRRAMTPSPLCSPARACLAFGRRYDEQPVRTNQDDVDPDAWNVYRAMRDTGYRVMGCGKFDLLKDSMDWGADGMHGTGEASRVRRIGFTGGVDSAGKHDCIIAFDRERGEEPYRHFLMERGLWEMHHVDFAARVGAAAYTNTTPTPLPDDAYCDNWIAETGRRIIGDTDEPWFLQVNFNGPHEPLDVTRNMYERWRDRDVSLPVDNDQYEAREHQAMRRNYGAMIENIDTQVGAFLSLLEETRQLDNTVVIYSSDHGDNLGDHNKWHKTTPQQGSVRVPLVIAGPSIPAGISDVPVDLVDVTATLLDVAGAEGSTSGLTLTSGRPARSWLTSGFWEWRLVTDGRYKYVHNYDPAVSSRDRGRLSWTEDDDAPHSLYDLEADPGEQKDLADDEPGRCMSLRDTMLDLIGNETQD